MENLNFLLSTFQSFLSNSWATVETAFSGEYGETKKADWLQANWELLVEDGLADNSIVLLIYGDGADIGAGASSRVTFPDLGETHHITVLSNKNAELDLLNDQLIDYSKGELIFDRLVAIKNDGWYYEEHPFDKILCLQNGKKIIVPFKRAKFELTAKLEQSRP